MRDIKDIQILQNKDEFYNHEYPWALDLVDEAESTHWKFDETNVEGDIQDLSARLTKPELKGISEVLRLFTLYETKVGGDYWSKFVREWFPRPEIEMMASRFSYDEVVHARSYSEINRVLGWDTEEFMTFWKKDKPLLNRMKFIGKSTLVPDNPTALDILQSLGTFTFIEGCVLFSSFSYIKHFKANGKNLLNGIVSAIDYSQRDEARHVAGGQMLFNTLLQEAELSPIELKQLHNKLIKVSAEVMAHESEIVERIFSHGQIIGITANQMRNFINNRARILLEDLGIFEHGLDKMDCPIEKWFYANVDSIKMADFFSKQTNAYSRHWKKEKF